MAHACSSASVADFLRGKSASARALYAGFERLVAAQGPYLVSPARTRVSFQARVRFANVTALGARGMTCNFALPRPLTSARFSRVQRIQDDWWVHWLRISAARELDRELAGWLARSYRLMGMQQRLRRARARPARAGTGSGSAGRSRAPSRSRG
jgi:hypothetical protein